MAKRFGIRIAIRLGRMDCAFGVEGIDWPRSDALATRRGAIKLGMAHQRADDPKLGHADRPTVPGYRLLERLSVDSRGGVEVWRAEGPGGFQAALRVIRIVPGIDPAEHRGLEVLRRARHPNLLSSFGSWPAGAGLIVATELPDRSLWDRYLEAAEAGSEGLSRGELLDHLGEAARGIDYLNGNVPSRPDLPALGAGFVHGGITPRSIVLVGGGIKVAEIDPSSPTRPFPDSTPSWRLDYAAPERLAGIASRHSDQYSLAIVYCHLRTGRLPFVLLDETEPSADSDPRAVDLSALPAVERRAIVRALAHDPDCRWPSCTAFIEAIRQTEVGRGAADEPEALAARPPFSRSTALTFAAATSAATLAGTLFLNSSAFSPSLPDRRRESDRTADVAPLAAATNVRDSTGTPPGPLLPDRLRARDPSDTGALAPSSLIADAPAPPPLHATEPVSPGIASPIPVLESTFLGLSTGVTSVVPWLTHSIEASINPGPFFQKLVAADRSSRPRVRPPSIRLEAPPVLSVEIGRTTELPVRVSCETIADPINVSLEGLPQGITASVRKGMAANVADAAGTTSRVVQVRVAASFAEGEVSAQLVALAGPARAETTIRLSAHVRPALAERRRGDLLLRGEAFDQAAAAYSEAIRLDPTDLLALHGRALAEYGKGDLAAALVDIDAALRIDPAAPTALNNRGLIKLAQNDLAGAIADFDAAIALDPAYAVVRYNRGRAHSETKAIDKALADFDEAIRLDPGFAKAYKARGDALAHRGDRDSALADYDNALRLRPDDPAALNNRGLLLFAKGDAHHAIADFDEAIRISPGYAVVRYNRGRVYAYLGDTTEAVNAFDQALRLDPTLARASQARAEILSRRAEAPVATRPNLGTATRRETSKRLFRRNAPQ